MHHHVFLSYSRKDSEMMKRIKNSFISSGLNVWTDEKIDLGTPSWRRSIESAITATDCVVCLLSPDAKESEWVRKELEFSDIQDKPIFPVLIRGDKRNAIPFELSGSQWIDLRCEINYNSQVESLITTVKNRFLVESKSVDSILPRPFEWCEIPSTKIYKNSRSEIISQFWVSKYPVTNRQFQYFLDDPDGYTNAELWDRLPLTSQQWFKLVRYPAKSTFSGDWCPRENVNWHEAKAFCYWLSSRLDLSITLPTQQQRNYLVRGQSNNLYPWGNKFDNSACNTRENLIGRTTSVVKYLNGSNEFGVMDLSGNVWEWSSSDFRDENGETVGYYVHGGGWRGRRRHTAANFSRHHRPDYRAPDVGFRVCATI